MRINQYMPLPPLMQKQYDDDTQQVARWARDIKRQAPDISHGEAIRIAEKWLVEWKAKQ